MMKISEISLHSSLRSYIFWIIVIGLASRIVVSIFLTYPNDSGSWSRFAEAVIAGSTLYDRHDYYYNPVWGYVLAFLTDLSVISGIGSFGNQFDELIFLDGFKVSYYNSMMITPEFAIVLKAFLILVDLVVAVLIRKLLLEVTGDGRKAAIGMAIWFLSPLTIYSSAAYVIFDNLEVLFLVICFYLLYRKSFFLAGSMFLLALMTKPFPAYILPLLVIFVFSRGLDRREGIRNVVMSMFGFLVGFLILYAPVIASGEFVTSFIALTGRVGTAADVYGGFLSHVFRTIMTFGSQVFIWMQPLIISFAFILAYAFWRSDRQSWTDLISCSALMFAVVFIWPVSQQCYYEPLILLMALMVSVMDGRRMMRWSMLLSVLSLVYLLLSHNFSLLLPLACYTDLIPLDWVLDNLTSFTLSSVGRIELYDISRWYVQLVIMVVMVLFIISMVRYRKEVIS